MALSLAQKQDVVRKVAEVAAKSHSAVAAEYRGLTVEEMSELRKKARASGVYLKVVRNTLAKKAIEGTSFACMQDSLSGPIFLAFSLNEPNAAARLIKNFAKDHEKLVVKVLSISGKVLEAKELDTLASLPTFNEAIAKLMGTMQAPIAKLARTLAEPSSKLVRTLAAVRDKMTNA